MTTVRLGTRGSALAVTQSRWVGRALESAARAADLDLAVELVEIRTQGDVDPTALAALGGVGVFATALREALLSGECDLAVHSYKDLPTAPTPGLRVACVPPREDPCDVLCVKPDLLASRSGTTGTGPTVGAAAASSAASMNTTESAAGTACAHAGASLAAALDVLPRGARVGTGSPRRWAQLLALRPDLTIVPIRGNVPTRLSRVVGDVVGTDGPMGRLAPGREADLDAVVLAYAGLRRLGLGAYASVVLNPEVMLPAAAQGALAVEVREDATTRLPVLTAALALIDDPLTRACATAERALMRQLGAGCAAPVGALAISLDTPPAHPGEPAVLPTRGTSVPAQVPAAAYNSSPDHRVAPRTWAHSDHPGPGSPAVAGAQIRLDAAVVSLDGTQSRRVCLTGPADDAARLGRDTADQLLTDGAGQITDLHATKGSARA